VLMRDIDGFMLCRMLRDEPAMAGVPIVLVSSYFQSEMDRTLASLVGANGFAERTTDFQGELAVLLRALELPKSSAAFTPDPKANEIYARSIATKLNHLIKRTEASDARYQSIFDNASDAIFVLDLDARILETNRRGEDLLLVPRKEMVGRHIREFSAEGYEDSNVGTYRQAVADGQGISSPVVLRRPDGSVVYVEFSMTLVDLDDQRVMLSFGRDISEQYRAAEARRAAEAKYRSLVENIPGVVWSSSSAGAITYMAPSVLRTCGFTPEEVALGGSAFWFERIHPEDRSTAEQSYQAFITDGGEQLTMVYRWRHKDGRWIWLRSRCNSRRVEAGVVHCDGLFVDITHERQLEDSLRQAQKAEAIAQLTGGVAHDFNNILSVILVYAHLLLDGFGEKDPRRADVEEIRNAGERAASLTRQLLAFSRRQVVEPANLDLNEVVGNLHKMLHRLIGEDVQLKVQQAQGLGIVRADPGQVEQIIMNLAVNARDAMPEGGTISIETANVDVDVGEASAAQLGLPPGGYVSLTVVDTGSGMDADTAARAFEPFFTTKEKGKGTGLGLSTCDAIVKQSGGYIALDTAPGRGATFRIYLPRLENALVPAAAPAAHAEPRGSETILLVEDDERVRLAVTRTLSSLGYRVLPAANGEQALAMSFGTESVIDMILTDVVVPGQSGPEIVKSISAKAGATAPKVLFMSGYIEHAMLRDGVLTAGNFIDKPFRQEALAKKVRAVLDS
jgi:two-component system, cell cycle sensor histidine kinase and response regulator CckA